MKKVELYELFFNNKNKKTSIAFILIFIVFFALIIIELKSSYDNLIQFNEQNTFNLTKVIDNNFEFIFDKSFLGLKEAKDEISQIGIDKITVAQAQKILKKRLTYLYGATAVKMISPDGSYFADADGLITHANLKDRDYFVYLQNNDSHEMYIAPPVISKSINKWVVVCALRLNFQNGLFGGLLIVTYEVENLAQSLKELQVTKDGSFGLLNMDRVLMLRLPAKPDLYGKVVTETQYIDKLLADKNFDTTIRKGSIDPVLKVLSLRKMKKYPFYIIASKSYDELIRGWKNRVYFQLTIVLLVLFSIFQFLKTYFLNLREIDEQMQKMMIQSKFSSLGEMASGIAHEINNPLSVILNSAHLVRKKIESNISPLEIIPSLEKIEKTALRISKIVRGLKSFSRNSENDPMEKIQLSSIWTGAFELFAEKFKNNGVSVIVSEVPDCFILCRETQISQVILNLMSNAFDAIIENDEKWVRVHFTVLNNLIQIRITDSGHGISANVVDKMMQPFYSTKDVGKGTGLGLSISLGIVQEHQGQLKYELFEGHTSFLLLFPKV